jgi:hypothetical protein
METPPKTPNLTRPEAISIVLSLLVGGGLFIWFMVSKAGEPFSVVLAPIAGGIVLGIVGAFVAYHWVMRRLADGRPLGQLAMWTTVGFGAGTAALVRQGPVALQVAVLSFCLVVFSTIMLLVHVWPRHRTPEDRPSN